MSDLQTLIDELLAAAMQAMATGTLPREEAGSLSVAGGKLARFLEPLPRVHVVHLSLTGWALEHPLSCRRGAVGDLARCPYSRAALNLAEAPRQGMFEVSLSAPGDLVLGPPLQP